MTPSRIQLQPDLPESPAMLGKDSAPTTSFFQGHFWFALVLVLSALYMAHKLKRGWIPSDDGALGRIR